MTKDILNESVETQKYVISSLIKLFKAYSFNHQSLKRFQVLSILRANDLPEDTMNHLQNYSHLCLGNEDNIVTKSFPVGFSFT